jgi:hypothetical protein
VIVLSLGLSAAAGTAPVAAAPAAKRSPVTQPAASPPVPTTSLEGAPETGIEVGPTLPAPTPPSKGEEIEAGKASHPGFFDIGGKIEQAINDWFAGLVKDALNPAMLLVGRTLLSTPQIAGEAEVRSYWQLSLGIADALLVLVVMAAGVIVMHHETLQSSYALKDFIPRLIIAGIASNASLAISGQMVAFANVLSSGLLGNGVNPEQAGHTLELLVLHAIADGGIFLVLLGLACAVLGRRAADSLHRAGGADRAARLRGAAHADRTRAPPDRGDGTFLVARDARGTRGASGAGTDARGDGTRLFCLG